jgi:hypothetical protein
MATVNVADAQAAVLADLYGTDTVGDGMAQWVAANGPEWEDIVSVVETATSLPFASGWGPYWVALYDALP